MILETKPAGASATGRVTHVRQTNGAFPDEERHTGPLDWGIL